MKIKNFAYTILLIISCQILSGCLWARRCPERSCSVSSEHRHEGGVYRPRSAFSWVTAKKHWPWKAFGNGKKKKYDGKKDKKTGKTKFKYLLPGEKQ